MPPQSDSRTTLHLDPEHCRYYDDYQRFVTPPSKRITSYGRQEVTLDLTGCESDWAEYESGWAVCEPSWAESDSVGREGVESGWAIRLFCHAYSAYVAKLIKTLRCYEAY